MAHGIIKPTEENEKGYSLYYSKYHFKNDTLVRKEILYEGKVDNCPKDLLEGIKINHNFKFIRVWKEEPEYQNG